MNIGLLFGYFGVKTRAVIWTASLLAQHDLVGRPRRWPPRRSTARAPYLFDHVQSMMRPFMALLVTAMLAATARAATNQPNIVFILADDIGYGDLGCYGATKIKTPSCDRLAREGLRFTDAHSSSAMCTPSRYSLMTEPQLYDLSQDIGEARNVAKEQPERVVRMQTLFERLTEQRNP